MSLGSDSVIGRMEFKKYQKRIEDWSVDDVLNWLEELEMGAYSVLFSSNKIDGWSLKILTCTLLKEIGIEIVGHRILILQEIKRLESKNINSTISAIDSIRISTQKSFNQERKEESLNSPRGQKMTLRFSTYTNCTTVLKSSLLQYGISSNEYEKYALFLVEPKGKERILLPNERPLEILENLALQNIQATFVLRKK